MVYPNGQIPTHALCELSRHPGAYLTCEAANSWERVCDEVERRFGWRPAITSIGDAYRSLERQVAVFRQRYVSRYATYGRPPRVDRRGPWLGLYWWRFTGAAAALPGQSNHGKGVAADVTGLGGVRGVRYAQFKMVAEKHGWSNTEGLSVEEAWHWVYSSSRDIVLINNPGVGHGNVPTAPVVTPPAPIIPKDWFDMVSKQEFIETTTAIIEGVLSREFAAQPTSPPAVYALMEGGQALWLDLGASRRWISDEQYDAMGNPPIVRLNPTDNFWRLPILGLVGEVFRKAGEDAAYVFDGREVRWITADQHVALGEPVYTDLDPAHGLFHSKHILRIDPPKPEPVG
jgi:hypothetical protein